MSNEKYKRGPTLEIDSGVSLEEDYAAYQGEVPPDSLVNLLKNSEPSEEDD
ncbi:MAG: hypothetical protein GOV15_03085 [Candidatus Diapherotrites archaeon]|nr:hypothetical protein [Candidatus Diapherotrites archaeon]